MAIFPNKVKSFLNRCVRMELHVDLVCQLIKSIKKCVIAIPK